jgi:hypothetical protein
MANEGEAPILVVEGGTGIQMTIQKEGLDLAPIKRAGLLITATVYVAS